MAEQDRTPDPETVRRPTAPVVGRCPAVLCGMHPPHPHDRDGQRAHLPRQRAALAPGSPTGAARPGGTDAARPHFRALPRLTR